MIFLTGIFFVPTRGGGGGRDIWSSRWVGGGIWIWTVKITPVWYPHGTPLKPPLEAVFSWVDARH